MAFTSDQATIMRPATSLDGIYDENVLVRVLDIDPDAHVIKGEVIPTSSCTLPAQEILVRMDLKAISTPERERFAQRARGSWFGGQIDDRTAAYFNNSTQLIVAQSSRTDPTKPGVLFARWLVSMGQEDRVLHGRATLITSLESDYENGPQFAKVRRLRLWMSNALDMANPRHIESVRTRLAQGARNSQLPRNHKDPNTGKPVFGAALRRYAFSLIVLSDDDQTICERSPVFSSYLPDPATGYPDYVPDDLRYTVHQGERQPRAIPVDECFFDMITRRFRDYLQERGYPESTRVVIALACDFFPAQESGMKTKRPYTPSSAERYAKAHQACSLAWPVSPDGENNLEINLAVTDVIITLSPQQNAINDYINNAVISYPLAGTFMHHLAFNGSPLLVPPEFNQEVEV